MKKFFILFILLIHICNASGALLLLSKEEFLTSSKVCQAKIKEDWQVEKDNKTYYVLQATDTHNLFKPTFFVLKRYGMSYCLKIPLDLYLDKKWGDDYNIRMLCGNLSFDGKKANIDGAFNDLKEYFKKQIALQKHNNTITPNDIQHCLYIYDSLQYNTEVERIVKKYCKECE